MIGIFTIEAADIKIQRGRRIPWEQDRCELRLDDFPPGIDSPTGVSISIRGTKSQLTAIVAELAEAVAAAPEAAGD